MKRVVCALLLLSGLAAGAASAQDRLSLSVNGSTLSSDDSNLFDSDDGNGGSIGWLHNFSPDAVAGIGAEYQSIGDAQWQFASLRAALTRGPSGKRRSLYGEFHRGDGEDDTHDFTYQIGMLGVALPLAGRLSMQLEDKQIDVDTSHGNMPKLGLTMAWTPRLQTGVAYAQSISGNLRTKLGSVRLDHYGSTVHTLIGGAVGRANPVVLNLDPGTDLPGFTSREGYIGFSRPFSRAEFLVLADYLKVADIERVTLTLSCTVNLRSGAPRK